MHAKSELIVRMLQGTGAAAIVLALVSVVLPSVRLGSGTFLMTLGILVVAMPLWRVAFDGLTNDPHLEERVLIVGTGSIALTVAKQMRAQHDFAYRLVGFIEDPSGTSAAGPVLGTRADLQQVIEEYAIDRIVVGLTDRRGQLPIDELLQAKLAGVRVEDAATTYERMTGKILVDDLKPSWLIFSDGFEASRVTRLAKRLFDLMGALIGVVLAAPIMLLTALAIRLESPGPVLYRQERVGENGRLFTLCKFRSMRIDAEQGTPIWANQSDDRVTRVGRVHPAHAARRAAAVLERAARRDELRRTASRASVLRPAAGRGDPVLHGAARGQAGRDRLGAGPLPLRRVGRRRAREAALRPVLHEASVARLRPDDPHRHREGDGVPERCAVSDTAPPSGAATDTDETLTVARNVSTRYLAIGIEAVLGLVVLPFNIAHLGTSAYGLWMLTASITAYFSVLDMGYSGALVKFVAQYRARRDYAGAERDPEHDVRRVRRVRRRHLPGRHRDRAVPRTPLHALARTGPRRPDRAADHQPERRGAARRSTCSAA